MAYIGTGLALCIASQCTNHTGLALCIDTSILKLHSRDMRQVLVVRSQSGELYAALNSMTWDVSGRFQDGSGKTGMVGTSIANGSTY